MIRTAMEAVAPNTKLETLDMYEPTMRHVCELFDIGSNPQRLAMFMAQCAHESAGFSVTEENLNYSERALLATFSKYFDSYTAKAFARKPERIANIVYSNRMGNGDEVSGDGWEFRGRGLIQLTGKSNYYRFADAFQLPRKEAVMYVETPEGAVYSAGWFWGENKINDVSDDIFKTTRRINGGLHGIDDRIKRYENAKKALNLQ